jgi:hypothetical protein
MSKIRLWTLGSLEEKMLPGPGAIQKLADMLAEKKSGVDLDIVWGPELKVYEFDATDDKPFTNVVFAPSLFPFQHYGT